MDIFYNEHYKCHPKRGKLFAKGNRDNISVKRYFMKHLKLGLIALLPMCLAGCNSNGNASSDTSGDVSSDISSDISSALTFNNEFRHEAGNVGFFSLTFSEEGHGFIESISEDLYSNFTFGAAFEGFEIYSLSLLDDGSLGFVTIGELANGYSYGTVKGSGITDDGGTFQLNIPILAAKLSADGLFYSTKDENTITLTLEHGAFHSDVDKDDFVFGGGLLEATIDSVVPVESTAYEILEHESYVTMYQSVDINFSEVHGPEEYGYITALEEGTTYNEDLMTSFDFLRMGGQLLTEIVTCNLKDDLVFAFSNLTLNTSMTLADISVTGALEGTSIDAMEIIDYLGYGKALSLEVTYPSTFFEVALTGNFEDLVASFAFTANTNVEGEAFEVYCSVPQPDIDEEYTFDSETNTITTTLSFGNGYFNKGLTASDFSYDVGPEDIAITNPTLTMNSTYNDLEFTCTLPSDFDHGFVDLTITNLYIINYAFEEKTEYRQYDSVQYLA